MTDETRRAIDEHRALLAALDRLVPAIDAVAHAITESFGQGGRVIAFGNGGAAAEADHFVAELLGRSRRERDPLPAFALSSGVAAITALSNDYGFAEVFARQVRAHARVGDVVVGITTSGMSENVVRGLAAAKERGATTVLLNGTDGGLAAAHARHAILVPSTNVARVQEMHVLVVHLICERVDEWAAQR